PPVAMPTFERAGSTLADARSETRRVRFDGQDLECAIYQRERIDVGLTLNGPAVLDQLDCTTVTYPGQTAPVAEWKNLTVPAGAGLGGLGGMVAGGGAFLVSARCPGG